MFLEVSNNNVPAIVNITNCVAVSNVGKKGVVCTHVDDTDKSKLYDLQVIVDIFQNIPL